VFSITRPTSADIDCAVEEYSRLNLQAVLLNSRQGLRVPRLPRGFAHDRSRSPIGKGRDIFNAAVSVFQHWKQFDLGWVRVANPDGSVEVGQVVVVEVHALGLWSLNLSQIVDMTRDPHTFGFIYKTTKHHAEQGEERFLLTFDPLTQEVHYELEAVSMPRHWVAKVGYPATRAFQHRFARDSHQRVREAVSQAKR
jgi:uncharacterized protein (UPF0548 family)